MTQISVVGGPDRLRAGFESLLTETGADEIIATAHIFDHAARVRSYEIAAEVFQTLSHSATH